ncbi:23S rRNA (uracil(1939)-C(5))-methyltransferase RlmD [Pontibacter sp. G13]|uniref:23S rRNA (uracil(1939)-C(5))-methyltransferase RlmD n=1 Tax=Pontibacter sp. G13 TaxID=3074898 RepID=UPI00288BDDF6|nr:23S rRNA (uracil(1939)-C(5))-methyltransferase RlmD [Pontibacter sp. G13]WNJ19172.1 23S rRNA (uracil(1939)-C(5))-methyltransferase RlmD [Pontibacter sp. G13]
MARRIKPFTAEMELIDAASDGRAVARHEGQVIFVEGGVPGDVADIHVFRKHKKSPLGRIEVMKQPSPYRTEAQCKHFENCGGCKWQHMTYEGQLAYKEKQVRDTIERIGKVEVAEHLPILGVDEPFFYRNKLEFSFANKAYLTKEDMPRRDEIDHRVLGFHAPGFFDKVLPIEECMLQLPIVNDIRNELQRYTREQEIEYYDHREHTGIMRSVTFRSSIATGELMMILVVAKDDQEMIDGIFGNLAEKFPEIDHFIWIHSEKLNSSYNDLPYKIWRGKEYLTEKLENYEFRVRPVSFFQTNPKQAEALYGVVRDFLKETLAKSGGIHETIYDLYSGTGSIGIFVSEYARKIVGIEYVESAVADASENVKANGLPEDKFKFFAGDMKKILTDELTQREGHPAVVIADPPRQGMDPKVVRQILKVSPDYVIYVSCKPATQARDLEMMDRFYSVEKMRPVDMFPHTGHVENVVLLKRRDTPLPPPAPKE